MAALSVLDNSELVFAADLDGDVVSGEAVSTGCKYRLIQLPDDVLAAIKVGDR